MNSELASSTFGIYLKDPKDSNSVVSSNVTLLFPDLLHSKVVNKCWIFECFHIKMTSLLILFSSHGTYFQRSWKLVLKRKIFYFQIFMWKTICIARSSPTKMLIHRTMESSNTYMHSSLNSSNMFKFSNNCSISEFWSSQKIERKSLSWYIRWQLRYTPISRPQVYSVKISKN